MQTQLVLLHGTAQHGTAQQGGTGDTAWPGQTLCWGRMTATASPHTAVLAFLQAGTTVVFAQHSTAQYGTVQHSTLQHNKVEQMIQHGHGRHFVGAGRLQLLLLIQLPLPFCRQAQLVSLHITAQYNKVQHVKHICCTADCSFQTVLLQRRNCDGSKTRIIILCYT